MELSEIMALVKAGFTKDEIMQMAQPTPVQSDPEPVPMDTPVPTPEPEQAPVVAPVAVATPEPVPEPNQPTMADLMQGIAKLTSAVQANAIAHSNIPLGLQNPPKAEDMLAEIIRPTIKERR